MLEVGKSLGASHQINADMSYSLANAVAGDSLNYNGDEEGGAKVL